MLGVLIPTNFRKPLEAKDIAAIFGPKLPFCQKFTTFIA
jgi:hypothetical protein